MMCFMLISWITLQPVVIVFQPMQMPSIQMKQPVDTGRIELRRI